MTSVAIANRESILESIASGKLLHCVASELGVSKQAISKELTDDPEYQEAIRCQVQSIIEEAKDATWDAKSKVDISRAGGMRQFAFRYAESMDKTRWAPHSTVVNATLAVVIEGELAIDALSLLGSINGAVLQAQAVQETGSDDT